SASQSLAILREVRRIRNSMFESAQIQLDSLRDETAQVPDWRPEARRFIGRLLPKQPKLLANLDCLRTALCAQLPQYPAGVGLHGVFADEKLFSNLACTQSLRDEFQYVHLAGCDA